MKIKYKNVCSLRNEEVEFKPGELICIKGETNQGKSALFYSLLDGFTGSPNFKKYINNEALAEDPKATAWIGLTDDCNNLYQVEAGTGHMNYRINEAKQEKVVHKAIFSFLDKQIPGLLYDPDDTRKIMNIQGEDDGLFPIDRSDAQIFKTYERLLSLSCTEDILRAIKLDVEDIDFKSTEIYNTIQKQTEQQVKIDEVLANVDIQKLQKVKDTIISYLENIQALTKAEEDVSKFDAYVRELDNPLALFNVTFNLETFKSIVNDLIKASNIQKYIDAQYELKKTKSFDTNELLNLCQDLSVATAISKDIELLNSDILTSESSLADINTKLSTVKVCPYCNRPMEE